MTAARYKAFISYSHRDEKWAKWLQRSLERYRVPRRLVGKETAHGPVPTRLRPVFRDREDLSSASDLTARIIEELEGSEFLVVICSPAAAQSRWVSEEIRQFRQAGGNDRMLALVVDGDPHDDECFPEALLEGPDGARREPLAADVRKYADGRHLALLKIIAGMLGIRLDELRRRDAHRRLQRRLTWGFAGVALVLVLGWLLYAQATSREAARVQRANTEELLSYMLGDLQRLDPIAGVENTVIEHPEYAARMQALGLADWNSEDLFEKALSMRETGLDLNWEGRLEEAMEQFQDSHATLIELHRREGNTDRVLFELSQAEFYVGEGYVRRGEVEKTREHWVHYGALARRLLNRQPNNPRYVMELSYTLMNLGALEHERAVPDIDKSLELLQAALQYNQMALVLDPRNPEFRDSLPTQLAWLADTWVRKCSLGNALEARQESVALRRELVNENPGDPDYLQTLAFSLSGLAGVQNAIGLGEEAVGSFEEATGIMRRMHEAEPDNREIEWEVLFREARLARLLFELGETGRAWNILEPMAGRIYELARDPEHPGLLRAIEAGSFENVLGQVMIARGEREDGAAALRESVQALADLARDKPDIRETQFALAWAAFEHWQQLGTFPLEAQDLLQPGLLPEPDASESCSAANLAARLAVAEGNLPRARRYVDYALGQGYFAPDFINFCKRYGLCELQ